MRYPGYLTALAFFLFCGQNTFAQVTKLQSGSHPPESWFGWSSAIDGDVAIVGAPLDDSHSLNAGAAYIFERQPSGEWVETAQLFASNASAHSEFGFNVSINGDWAAVRGMDDSQAPGAGAVYLFERQSSGIWLEKAKLNASDTREGDFFGHRVSLQEDRMIVSAVGEDTGGEESGAAYVFERDNGGIWSEVAKLKASEIQEGARFGQSADIDGDRAVVGAWIHDGQVGAAFVFERDGNGTWSEVAVLQASDAAAPAYWFGRSAAIDGDRIIVGSSFDLDNRTGSAYIFERDTGGTWNEIVKLQADDKKPEEGFGHSVAMDGDWVIVGTNIDERSASPEGSAYVFKRDASGAWQQHSKLLAPDNTGYVDQFAWSVSISGSRAIVGSFLTGQDGSGAAYVYDDVTNPIVVIAPTLVQPEDRSVQASACVDLSWEPFPEAQEYYVEVSTDATFQSTDPDTVAATTYRVESLTNRIRHYWRVRASNSQWYSEVWSFTASSSAASNCTATNVQDSALPQAFSLAQNYPNPFNPTTTISYALPQAAAVTLTVVDVLGRTIRELASGTKPAGTYKVSFDATGLPSGVYFYRLHAADYVETKRMVVVK
jgi:hypothetical protein